MAAPHQGQNRSSIWAASLFVVTELQCLAGRIFISILPWVDCFVFEHLDELVECGGQQRAGERTHPVYLLPSVPCFSGYGLAWIYPVIAVE